MSPGELQAVVRQGQRYFLAAQQDRDPVIQHTHLNYAVQLFELALAGAPRWQIRQVAGLDIDQALARARAAQDQVQQVLLTAVHGPLWLEALR